MGYSHRNKTKKVRQQRGLSDTGKPGLNYHVSREAAGGRFGWFKGGNEV